MGELSRRWYICCRSDPVDPNMVFNETIWGGICARVQVSGDWPLRNSTWVAREFIFEKTLGGGNVPAKERNSSNERNEKKDLVLRWAFGSEYV
ncbi:hypothetical protein SDJN02_23925, partial [Cucurbita argyrosperma subsp. argyrosperma]